jgi:hypothetical protein
MTRESEFTDKCDTCGKYGVVILKRIYKKKPYNPKLNSKPNPKPEDKQKTEYDPATLTPYTTKVSINRGEHPHRYLGVLSYLFAPKVLLNEKMKSLLSILQNQNLSQGLAKPQSRW